MTAAARRPGVATIDTPIELPRLRGVNPNQPAPGPDAPDPQLIEAIYQRDADKQHRAVDHMFLWLLIAEWAFAVLLAACVSPYSWSGSIKSIHLHVQLAVLLGGALNALPFWLILKRPGTTATRLTISVVQGLWSGLLIHLSGGRLETHFHIFGSLALLAFYRDWRALAPATLVTLADHLLRGLYLPESLFGTRTIEEWRFLEHTGWVMFEVTILAAACVQGAAEMRLGAWREAKLKAAYALLTSSSSLIEEKVALRTAELAATQAQYRSVIEACSALPYELDYSETGTFKFIGPAVERICGWPCARYAEPGFLTSCLHPDDLRSAQRAFWRAAIGEQGIIEYRFRCEDGSYATIRNEFVRVPDDEGRHLIRGLSIDITAQRALEVELRQAQKLESVGRLAAGVAHEINTPVQFVSDSVQFVQEAMQDLLPLLGGYRALEQAVLADRTDSNDPIAARARQLAATSLELELDEVLEEMPRALTRSMEGLGRVAGIVRSMKEFAHPDQRKMTPIDLNHAVDVTLIIARSEYKLVADVETRLGELPQIVCSASEINQVLLNLIVNAAQAIEEVARTTHKRGLIRIATAREGDAAVLSISDSGAGIPLGIQDQIFDPFFTTKEVGKGTGQGLALARAVIEGKHQGKLSFTSEPGIGSTFTVRIPIAGPALH